MKKVIAVMLALVMAFALCVPSFAEGEESSFDISAIVEQVKQIIGSIGGGEGGEGGVELPDIGGIIDGIINGGGETPSLPEVSLPDIDLSNITPEQAATVISIMQKTGATKEEIQATLDQMLADGQIPQESYDTLKAALDAAPETTTEAPVISDDQVGEAAQKIIDALKKAGVTNEQMQGVVDQLNERGIIPQNVYDEITRRINESENTTTASNEGGIGGFISGIVDKIKDLFGQGGDDSNNPGGGNDANSGNYEGKEPTGDTAILSVAAVAAVAGVALVLTRKKKDAE